MGTTGTIGDVLSGNKAIKVDIGVDAQSALFAGVVLFLIVLTVGIIIKKI
jgi:hypothetical protein